MPKKPGEKQKSKMRLKADAETSSVDDRLAQLEKEIQQSQNPNTPAPLRLDKQDIKAVAEVKESIFSSHGTSKKLALFWAVVIFSVILSKIPGLEWLFWPLNQFTTMVHEMGHAVTTIATGGQVAGMTIVPDGAGHGGLTFSRGGIPFIHVQAGYLGTAVFGCLLVYLSQFHRLSKGILIGIGSIMALGSIYFITPALLSPHFGQAFFSLIWGLAMAAATIYGGLKLKDSHANLLLLFLAIYTAMDSIRAISIVLQAILFGASVTSDANFMEQLFVLPAIFWAIMWATLSVVMLGTTVWFTYGFGSVKKKQISGSASQSKLIGKRK